MAFLCFDISYGRLVLLVCLGAFSLLMLQDFHSVVNSKNRPRPWPDN